MFKIVFVNEISSEILKKEISISAFEKLKMLELIKTKDSLILFSNYIPSTKNKDNFLFFLKDGCLFNTKIYEPIDISVLNEYFGIKNLGFSDFFEFLEFQYYDIELPYKIKHERGESEKIVFEAFKISQFYGVNKEDFRVFMDAKVRYFEHKNEYDEANQLGIKDFYQYESFKGSGYNKYQDYLDAQRGGFSSPQDYYDAKKIGITNFEDYKEFLNKPYKSYLTKIEEIDHDAKREFNQRRYADYIRLKYLSAEKLAEVVFFKIFKKEYVQVSEELKINEVISSIERKLNIKLEVIDKLNKWRVKRNQIVHEHASSDSEEAQEADNFFTEYAEKLNKIFE